MIGYITLGTNDFERAMSFYDALLGEVGIKRLWNTDSMAAWGVSREETALCITKPFDGERATVGNGVMIALKMNSQAEVDSLHAKALALGAKNEGEAGPRGKHGFYGGYFRDLDGNKLNAYIPASKA
jgi:predicted lactoylglutathione lyase